MDFELERDFESRTIREILRTFYKFHSEYVGATRSGLEPAALVLNPEKLADPSNPFSIDTYYAIYYRGYFVVIEQNVNHPFTGPHPAKLCFEVHGPTRTKRAFRIHLGTMQVEGNFYDTKKIRRSLRAAIARREYFVLRETLDELIEMTGPDDEAIAL